MPSQDKAFAFGVGMWTFLIGGNLWIALKPERDYRRMLRRMDREEKQKRDDPIGAYLDAEARRRAWDNYDPMRPKTRPKDPY